MSPRRGPEHLPKLSHLKRKGIGRVRMPGRGDVYLGRKGDWPADQRQPPAAILREYHRLMAELQAARAQGLVPRPPGRGATCGEVVSAYLATLAGRPWCATADMALRPVREIYGHTPAADFDGTRFAVCRRWHLDRGVAAATVNQYGACVRTAFRWAADPSLKLAPPSVAVELGQVRPLDDEESEPVGAVPEAVVLRVLPHCAPVVRAMLRLQLLTGMRPGEVVQLRAGDLDREADADGEGLRCWLYRPERYKGRHRAPKRRAGGRRVWLGPRAQALLRPWLKGKAEGDHVFLSRLGTPFGVPGYRAAVHRACDAAGLERFDPRQVRHTTLTAVEEATGSLDSAQAVGGHGRPDTTRRYAHGQDRLAREAMRRLG